MNLNIPAFLRAGLMPDDLRRLEHLLAQQTEAGLPALLATWSPGRQVLFAGLASGGSMLFWSAFPCETEAAGLAAAQKMFTLLEDECITALAAQAIDKARLQ